MSALKTCPRRDKFWLHPILSLRYETTAAQMRSVLGAIRNLLLEHPEWSRDSVRVRFLGFGSSSLDVEVFAYIPVLDFGNFLEIQEELLLRIMDAVQAAGTRMALPSQTTYVASAPTGKEMGADESERPSWPLIMSRFSRVIRWWPTTSALEFNSY